MPCLVLVIALVSPRLALFLTALFSDLLSRSMDSWFLPLLGFFFLSWTTLAYAYMWDIGTHEVAGFEWFIVGFALLVDLGAYGGGASRRPQRR